MKTSEQYNTWDQDKFQENYERMYEMSSHKNIGDLHRGTNEFKKGY
jgi:hypothetical protein